MCGSKADEEEQRGRSGAEGTGVGGAEGTGVRVVRAESPGRGKPGVDRMKSQRDRGSEIKYQLLGPLLCLDSYQKGKKKKKRNMLESLSKLPGSVLMC